ncbi:protein mono-ADP-ribosyltransferase PARP10 [Discoglossus pictus]
MAEVKVSGLTEQVDTEYLTLYFECKRVSGGGPVLSCSREGAEATITFQDPRDAEQVLSRAEHTLKSVTLQVCRAAPWDPGKVALHGLNQDTCQSLLDIYVENVSEREAFSTQLSADRTTALIIFQEPLSETDFQILAQRVAARKLSGATLSVQQVRASSEVLIQNVSPQIPDDLLELYLESRRSGGGRVQSLTRLRDSSAVIVSFHEWQAAKRVLSREHSLQGSKLQLSLYYPVLLGPQALPDSDGLEEAQSVDHGGEQNRDTNIKCREGKSTENSRANIEERSAENSRANIEERSAENSSLNTNERSAELRSQRNQTNIDQTVLAHGFYTQQHASNIHPQKTSHTQQVQSPDEPTWEVTMDDSHELDTGGTVRSSDGCSPVDSVLQLEVFMKPAELRFMQEKYHELLAGMDQVIILPLEGGDKTGFMVSGDVSSCQSAANLLQMLVSPLCSRSIALDFPGISLFLLEDEGQQLLQDIESQYNCVIDTSQLSLKALESEYVDPWSLIPQVSPVEKSPSHKEIQEPANMDDIRVLASVLQNSEEDSEDLQVSEEAPTISNTELNIAPEDTDIDMYADSSLCNEEDTALDEELDQAYKMSRTEYQARELDEEAELLLAIQRSMDAKQSATEEEDELQRALAASLREQTLEEIEEPLQKALEMSLKTQWTQDHGLMREDEEEAQCAVGTAKLTVVAVGEEELVVACEAIRKAVSGKLCTETVEDLVDLHVQLSGILSALQRKHRVSISICGGRAAVQGFMHRPTNCQQELIRILNALQGNSRQLAGQGMPPLRLADQDMPPLRLAGQDMPPLRLADQGMPPLRLAGQGMPPLRLADQGMPPLRLVGQGMPPLRLADQDMPPWRLAGQSVLLGSLSDQNVLTRRLADEGAPPGVELISVLDPSEEYFCVLQSFQNTLQELKEDMQVLEVHRIHNALLSNQYELKKQSMLALSPRGPVERILYHGTTESSAREICHNGFNRSFCGKNAALYGQGVYFAVQAVLSAMDHYSPPSSEGKKYILVAKVLTGQFTVGKQDMRAPPSLPDTTGEALRRYDSLVDSALNPSIFVIFNDTQAYPQYLITCSRGRTGGKRKATGAGK